MEGLNNEEFKKKATEEDENILKENGWEIHKGKGLIGDKLKELSKLRLEEFATLLVDKDGHLWIKGGNEEAPKGIKIMQRLVYKLTDKEKNFWEQI